MVALAERVEWLDRQDKSIAPREFFGDFLEGFLIHLAQRLATHGVRSFLSAIASLSWFSLDLYLGYDPSRVANGEGAVAGEHASEGQSDLIQLIERGL